MSENIDRIKRAQDTVIAMAYGATGIEVLKSYFDLVMPVLYDILEAQETRITALETRPVVSTYPKVYKDENGTLRLLLPDGSTPTFDEFKAVNK